MCGYHRAAPKALRPLMASGISSQVAHLTGCGGCAAVLKSSEKLVLFVLRVSRSSSDKYRKWDSDRP